VSWPVLVDRATFNNQSDHAPMRFKLLALLFLVFLAHAGNSQTKTLIVYDPSKYVLVNPRLIRGEIDYSNFSVHGNGKFNDRNGWGVRLRNEARIISSFMENEDHRFFLYDAFYFDLTMGKMTSKPYTGYSDTEATFATLISMGYDLYAGYRNERFGFLAGKKFNWNSARIGMTSIPGDGSLFYRLSPWSFRMEYCLGFNYEFRLVLSGWNSFSKERKNYGLKIDVPIHPKKRFFLTAEYNYYKAIAEANYFAGDTRYGARIGQFSIGFRVGSIY